MRAFNQLLLWPMLITCHLLMLALLSWHLLAKTDFLYPAGYSLLSIEQHIAEFAPVNHYKAGFEFTTPVEHKRLFGEINTAIHNDGNGLAQITYTLPNGQTETLLRNAEVIHLQDVANLVNVFYSVGLTATVLWILLTGWAWRLRLRFPSVKKILIGFAATIAALSLIIISLGATRVFYAMHTLIFPDEHEWFFFYEDSLMTTLMKAPDIFGLICVFIVTLFVILGCCTVIPMSRWLNQRADIITTSSASRKTPRRRPRKK